MKKLKYYIPTSFKHVVPNIFRYIAFMSFVIASLVSGTHAMKQPLEYGTNECELIAKDFQKEYGGSLIWIQPLTANGAYDFGNYNAHIINKYYDSDFEGVGSIIYYDYATNTRMYSIEDIEMWYEWLWGKEVKVFDLSKERPEFSMIWHY